MILRLKELREKHCYTKKFVAEYLNCDVRTYSNYESEKSIIRAGMIVKLAILYNVSSDYLIGFSNGKEI